MSIDEDEGHSIEIFDTDQNGCTIKQMDEH